MTAITELVIMRASQLTTERGASVGEIVSHIADRSFIEDMRKANDWAKAAVKVLRSAPDANFKTDEEAAFSILKKLYEKHPKLRGRKSIVPVS